MAVGRSCLRFADDLSSFVDQRLDEPRLTQLSQHLIQCTSCQAQVAELQALRSRLHSCANTETLPSSLEERLQRIAGEDSDQPLYFGSDRSRGGGKLSPVAAGVLLTSLAVVGLLVLSLALARDPQVVGDPVRAARQQYSMSLAAIDVQPGLGAVMWARQQGAASGAAVSLKASQAPEGEVFEIVESTAMDLLSGAESLTYSGEQRVWLLNDDGNHHPNDVMINQVSGQGTTLQVFDQDREPVLAWYVPELGCCASGAETGWQFFRYQESTQVAGRKAFVVSARDTGVEVARWWVDAETGVLLKTERYTTSGVPVYVIGFTSINYGAASLAVDTEAIEELNSSAAVDTSGWCVGLQECPESLAGLPLVALGSSQDSEPTSQRLVYSDGVRTISVTWVPGRLSGQSRLNDYSMGQPLVEAWQVHNGVVTVTTTASRALLAEACSQLPEQSNYQYGLLERIGSGLGRLVGLD